MAKSSVTKIEKQDDFNYRITSSSGNIYYQTCVGSVDLPGHPSEYGLLWDCSCPARKSCHHLKALIEHLELEEAE